jgi:predicted RNA-binding protein YlxR (DUF448 family)/ribosomal protein L30E
MVPNPATEPPDGAPRDGTPPSGEGASPRRRDRTCVGCRQATDPETVIRWVLAPDGTVVPDLARRAHGRGAWVHPRPECLRDAARRGLARSFRSPVRTSHAELVSLLRVAAERRVSGLLAAAYRARKMEIGSDAVAEALDRRAAELVIVACDARAAAETRAVRGAVAAGLVRAWGNKEAVGRACGRAEVGVVAVLDAGLAQALSTALQLAQMPAPAADPERTPRDGSTEDG